MTNPQTPSANSTELPRVSVVIPAYNAAAYISGTLRSVFAQTLSDVEVILVNDGSPDTQAFEQVLQPYLTRIRYFRQENRGPSAARNCGILEARGQYVAFLDSDDLWLPHHLARQMDIFKENPEVRLVYANAVHLKEDRPVGVAFETVPQSGEPTLDALLAERCTINTSSVVVQRDALLQAGLFDETMHRCEDFDLWLRLAGAQVRMTYDREIQVCHRLGDGLTANRILMKEGRARAYEKMGKRPGLTQAQQDIVRNKLKALDLEIQIELAKRSLLAGEYTEALSAATRANSLSRAAKLHLATLGLRYFPRLLRRMYTVYFRVLESYKRKKRVRSMKDLEIAGERVNFESLIRHRPTP